MSFIKLTNDSVVDITLRSIAIITYVVCIIDKLHMPKKNNKFVFLYFNV